jgi:uncharacterized membrane protein YfcA
MITAFLCIAAFAGGFIDSVAGGGGLITIPALLAAGVPPHAVLGTNKLQSMCGTACALANFHRHAKVLWRIAAAGIPFALAGSVIGARLALALPQAALAKVLVVILPPAAIMIFASRSLLHPVGIHAARGARLWIPTVVACFAVGAYDGFFGPGTGTFLIVALVLASRIPLINATATAKTFNLASNAGALATFVVSGNVDYAIALAMAAANVAGNYLGSRSAVRRGDEFVRRFLIAATSLLFAYLAWKYLL